MKLQVITFLASLLAGREATGFLSPSIMKPHVRLDSVMFSSLKEDETTASPAQATSDAVEIDPDAEGLPWWWELVWKLDMMKTGEPGEDIIFGDSANVLRTNIEQIYGGYPSLDGCPLAEGTYEGCRDFF